MAEPFVASGEPMSDSILGEWALGSLARALAFYGETLEANATERTTAIITYYSLFHLSLYLLFSCPKLLKPRERRAINKALQQAPMDPSPAVTHSMASHFVSRCVDNGLPLRVHDRLAEAMRIRVAVNYGPRLRLVDGRVSFNLCEANPAELEEVRDNLEETFKDVVRWLLEQSDNEDMRAGKCPRDNPGIYVGTFLAQVAKLFVEPKKTWNGWLSDEAARQADALRAELFGIADEHDRRKRELGKQRD